MGDGAIAVRWKAFLVHSACVCFYFLDKRFPPLYGKHKAYRVLSFRAPLSSACVFVQDTMSATIDTECTPGRLNACGDT